MHYDEMKGWPLKKLAATPCRILAANLALVRLIPRSRLKFNQTV